MSEKDMLGEVMRKLVELPVEMLGIIFDLSEKLLSETGREWFAESKKFLRKEQSWTGVVADKILRLISGDEVLTIDGSDGSQVDDGTITWHFEDGCDKEGANEPCPPTLDVDVEVYEMVRDATFTEMFGSPSSVLRRVFFSSRNQVRIFANKHRQWLRKGGFTTLIPYKSTNGNLFVAHVRVDGHGLNAYVDRFGYDNVWNAESCHRLVVPKQL